MRMHGRGRGEGWGRGRFGGEVPDTADAPAFIRGALPAEWYTGQADVRIDRDEIIITGELTVPKLADDAGDADRAAAEQGRIAAFRETTREQRILIARQLEHRYQRKVAWGATAGGTTQLFTTHSAPVMTRLRQEERLILDTLVDSGVAKSRSEALAWCVHLVGQHADTWLGELRDAMGAVDKLRKQGPEL
jgi:hypothetical protein